MPRSQADPGFVAAMAGIGLILAAVAGTLIYWEPHLVRAKLARGRVPAPASPAPVELSASAETGRHLYEQACAGCHGSGGDAATTVARSLSPRPRDFTTGIVKFKSTPWNRPPTRDDLISIVSEGVRWSAMPPFEERLSPAEIGSIADFLLEAFFTKGHDGQLVAPLEAPDPPVFDGRTIAHGKDLFDLRCAGCHGLGGHREEPIRYYDAWKQPVFPRDLTLPIYKRGSDPKSLYLRIRLGISGTPMVDPAHGLADEDIWSIVAYVRSVQQWPEEFVERGGLLYEAMGCAQCHGESGRGGVRNPNYVKGTPPRLDTLAERMFLDFEEDIAIFVGALGRRDGSLDNDASVGEIPRYRRVLGKYRAVKNVIRKGSPAAKADSTGPEPPLHMPTWYPHMSDEEIDSVVAYLLTLYEEVEE